MSNPKVTECWTVEAGDGSPVLHWVFNKKDSYHPAAAILVWREDYDAMRKELEELRSQVSCLKVSCMAYRGSAITSDYYLKKLIELTPEQASKIVDEAHRIVDVTDLSTEAHDDTKAK